MIAIKRKKKNGRKVGKREIERRGVRKGWKDEESLVKHWVLHQWRRLSKGNFCTDYVMANMPPSPSIL